MSDIEQIKKRLFSVIPTSSLHMMEFLKLMDVRFADDETESAAVTCTSRPELLLNRSFVETYCKRDEHLFMLMMHELYHIILGHTHLFKRHTDIDNIAFDAVINAILCRMFPQEEYVSFFTSINSESTFPGCLLRPIGSKTPNKYIPFLKNLYYTNTGTYYEAYEIILNELGEMVKNGKVKYILLGNHRDNNDDMSNPLLKKMVDKVISKWPRELVINGKDLGGKIEDKKIEFEKANREQQQKMKRLLKVSGVIKGSVTKDKVSYQYVNEDAIMVVPNYKDRTLLTKSIIYKQPVLYNSSLINRKITRDSNVQTLIYLDVSGSVVSYINKFAYLLLKPYKNKECTLFVFSTEVAPTTYKDFRAGNYKSTGGTDINCVFNHYFSLPKKKQTKKILILTDGDTGHLDKCFYQRIKKEKINVYCGLFGSYRNDYLKDVVKHFEEFN